MKKMKLYDESEKSEELEDEMKQRFWLLESLDKLHNIIVNICSSSDHITEFLKLASRMISLDNHTWWNSWYLSLIVADTHALSIDSYIKSHFADLSENYLTSQDWMRLCMIMIFLQSFHQATLETQEHHTTLEKVLFTMNILVQYFKTALVSKYNSSFLLESSLDLSLERQLKHIILQNLHVLILYDSLDMLLIKTFMLELRRDERFLTSIMSKQTLLLCMLSLLFCISIVVQSTLRQIDHQSESSLF